MGRMRAGVHFMRWRYADGKRTQTTRSQHTAQQVPERQMVSEEKAEKDEQEKAKSCINGSRARTIPTKECIDSVNTQL